MANQEHLDLTLNAENLVTGLFKAGRAFQNFDETTAQIAKSLNRFDKEGNIAGKRILLLDKYGRELALSLDNVKVSAGEVVNGIVQAEQTFTNISATTRQLTADQLAAAEAATLLAASLIKQTPIRGFGGQGRFTPPTGPVATREQQSRILDARDALVAMVRSGAVAQERVKSLFNEFKRGSLTVVDGERDVRRAILNVLKAYEAVGAEDRKLTAQRTANQERIQEELRQTQAQQARLRAAFNLSADRAHLIAPGQTRGISKEGTEQEKRAFATARRNFAEFSAASNRASKEAREALGRAQRGVLDYTNELTKAERVAVKLIETYRGLGDTARIADEKATAASQKVEATLLRRRRTLASLRGIRSSFIQQAGVDVSLISEKEVTRYRRAEEAIVQLKEQGKVTGNELVAAFKRARAGTLTFRNANSEAARAVLELVGAVRAFGSEATAANNKAAAARAKARQELIKERAALAARNQQLRAGAAIQAGSLRKSGLDTRTVAEGGIASKTQVQSLIQAEAAMSRLRASGKTTGYEISQAMAKARVGILQLGTAMTDVERAAYNLVAAEKQVELGAKKAATALSGVSKAVVSMGRLIGISLLIGGAFRLVTVLTDATSAVSKLSIKIAEIETITKNANFSTEEWADGLRVLSDEFDTDTLQQAEGAYQILSNQIKNASGEVIQGAEALKFLRVANQLATAGVTETANATNLLTATINAFRLSSADAGIVAAKLFKIVELGRVRIQDMSESFGRLVVPANQLGITLDEVGGAIAQTTIQGVKFSEASTLVRNIILKLIKPTDSMKGVFEKLGVASGEALIAQRGFVPALAAIEDQLGGTTTEIGKAFGRIRAITGALVFAGDGAKEAAEKIKEIRETTLAAFSADTQNVIQSTGKQLQIAGEQAQNFFEKFVGTPVLKAVAAFIKDLGGIEEALFNTRDAFVSLAKISISTYALLKAGVLAETAVAWWKIAKATYAAAKAQGVYNVILAASPLGIIAAVAAAALATTEYIKNESRDVLRAIEQRNIAIQKANEDAKIREAALEKAATERVAIEVQNRTRTVLRAFGRERAEITKTSKGLEVEFKNLSKRYASSISSFSNAVSKKLTAGKKQVTGLTKSAKDAASTIEKIFARLAKTSLNLALGKAGVGKDVKLLDNALLTSQERLRKEIKSGNFKQFEIERKQVNSLLKMKVDAEIQLNKTVSGLEAKLAKARVARLEARGTKARDLANERIKDIRRQISLAKTGTAQQFSFEQKLAKARETARLATTAKEKKAAFDALYDLKREQDRLNTLADNELKLREKINEAYKEQAVLIAERRKQDEEQLKLAKQQELRIRSLQFLFKLISQDATAFNNERITEGKTEKEINNAVAEQQTNLSRLLTISREINGDRSADQIFLERDIKLREQALNKIEEIKHDARDVDAREAEKAFQKELANLRTSRNLRLELLKDIIRRAEAFYEAGEAGKLTGIEGAAELTESAKKLFDLANKQTVTPTEENRAEIEKLIGGIVSKLGPQIAKGQAEIAEEAKRKAQAEAFEDAVPFTKALPYLGIGGLTRDPSEVGIQQLSPEQAAIEEFAKGIASGLVALPKSLDELDKLERVIKDLVDKTPTRPLSPEDERKLAEEAALAEAKARFANLTQIERATIRLKEFADVTNRSTYATPIRALEATTIDEILPELKDQLGDTFYDATKRGVEGGIRAAQPSAEEAAKKSGVTQAQAAGEESVRLAPSLGARIAEFEAKAEARKKAAEEAKTKVAPPRRLSYSIEEIRARQRDRRIRQQEKIGKGFTGRGYGGGLVSRRRPLGVSTITKEEQKKIEAAWAKNDRAGKISGTAQARGDAFRARQAGIAGGNISGINQARGDAARTQDKTAEQLFRQSEEEKFEKAERAADFLITLGESAADKKKKADRASAFEAAQSTTGLSKAGGESVFGQAARLEKRDEAIAAIDAEILENKKELLKTDKKLRDIRKQRAVVEARVAETVNITWYQAAEIAVLYRQEKELLLEARKIRKKTTKEYRKAQIDAEIPGVSGPKAPKPAENTITQESVDASKDAAIKQVASLGNLTESIDKLNKTLIDIEAKSRQQAAKQTGVRPSRRRVFADGGPVGTDTVPAMLTPGEFVVNRKSAQRFYPQLLAMNSGRMQPRGYAEGGSVEVGGISVTVNESSSPQVTAREVASQINRGVRTGTIKLRRS